MKIKKKQLANLVMVGVIALMILGGVLFAGNTLGWFDKQDGTAATLTEIRGLIQMQRSGVIYTVEKDTVLREGDSLTLEKGATAKILLEDGYLVLGEKAALAVTDSTADGFAAEMTAGELFASCGQAPALISFEGHQATLRQVVAHLSVRTGTQGISVFEGTAEEAAAGQLVEYIGEEVSLQSLQIAALNDFTIAQLRIANGSHTLYFTNEQLDQLESDRKQAMQDIINGQTPTVDPDGTTDGDETPTHQHQYQVSIVTPTCTAGGYTLHTCSCGESYQADATAATGHTWGDWVTTKAPTTTAEGQQTRTCQKCSASEQQKLDQLQAGHTHSYTDKKVAATCTTAGYTLHTCACGVSYQDNQVPARGHSYVSKVVAPTCTTQGYTQHTCACSDSYVDSTVAATGHTWSDWQTVKAATTSEEGLQKRTCQGCGASEEKTIAKLQPTVAGYVYITIRCDTILDNIGDLNPAKAEFVPANGEILPMLKVYFYEGDTVFDVLVRVCNTYNIQIEYMWSIYGSYYIESINNLYEKDCGDDSGWMYKVNEVFPNYGCSAYEVSDGDVIVWAYTCKGYGTDIGAPEWEG